LHKREELAAVNRSFTLSSSADTVETFIVVSVAFSSREDLKICRMGLMKDLLAPDRDRWLKRTGRERLKLNKSNTEDSLNSTVVSGLSVHK